MYIYRTTNIICLLLCLDFYIAHSKSYSSSSVQVALFGSGILYNKMFLHGRIMEQQKQSIVVCIPQTLPMNRMTTGQLRSWTDYTFLARIIPYRIRRTLPAVLHPSQYFGTPGSTIFEAVAAIRGAKAYAELTYKPLRTCSLDFSAAFERISHICLFRMLTNYGYTCNLSGS